MIKNYLKIAWRNMLRNKVYSFINIGGLAVGLAVAMLIMLYAKDEISYDRFHAHNPQIYRITSQWLKPDGSSRKDGNTGYLQGWKFKENIPEIQSFVRFQGDWRDIQALNEIKGYEMFRADSNFFEVFSFPLLSGNPQTALQKPNSIVISEEIAKKFFGTTNALGKTLDLKENEKFVPYLITGVSKKCPQNSSIKFDFLMPLIVKNEEYTNNENWFNFHLNTFVLINPQSNARSIEAKMKQVYEKDAQATIKKMREKYDVKETAEYLLQPFTEMHLSTDFAATNGLKDASNPMFSYILTGIAVFILLIACINFVNLTVARSLKRAKEIGVRKVVGGAKRQLIFQFLGESFLMSFISFVLAIFIAEFTMPIFNDLSNKSLAFSYLLDLKLIFAYVSLFLLTGLLAGFYPALVLSNYSPAQTLYGRFNLSGKNYLQKSLVVIQFGLASFLIIATLTIFSQFNYLTNKSLGYDDKNIVMIDYGQNIDKNKAQLFKEQLLKNSDIITVAPKNGGHWGTVAKVNGDTQIQFAYETVDEDYLPMFKIPMVQGRNFSKDFPADSSHSVIVNEAFAKEAGWKEPLGRVVDFWFRKDEKYTVVGVVKNYHYASLNEEIKPQLFTTKSNGFGMVNIKIKPKSETASLEYINKIFKNMFPINTFSYKFKDLENIKAYESEAKWKQIMLFGAILTVFISCIGLFGLATLSAEKRTKEIGIRKVLGASVSNLVKLLSGDFVRLVGLSLVFSFPFAYYAAQKWLENYPYRMDSNVWIFVFTACITVFVALLTVSFQAIKAALANPVKSLRSE